MYLLTPHLIGPEFLELFAHWVDQTMYLLTPHLIGPEFLKLCFPTRKTSIVIHFLTPHLIGPELPEQFAHRLP